jgi:hypothetical protein
MRFQIDVVKGSAVINSLVLECSSHKAAQVEGERLRVMDSGAIAIVRSHPPYALFEISVVEPRWLDDRGDHYRNVWIEALGESEARRTGAMIAREIEMQTGVRVSDTLKVREVR